MADLELKEEIVKLNSKVDKLLFILVGDEDYAQKGLVQKVEQHEKWIAEKRVNDAKIVAVSTIVSVIAGYLLNFYSVFNNNGN
jgi:hypothetical protein